MTEVTVIGAGIVGCAAAWFLAERGATVTVLERDRVAGAASGRNAGSIQHPLHRDAAALYSESVEIYRRIGVAGDAPRGMLALLNTEREAHAARDAVAAFGELEAAVLDPDALARVEPALAGDVFACRLATGYPAHPAAATERFAALAREAGVRLVEGVQARLVLDGGGRLKGVEAGGERHRADAVLVAAGPWTAQLIAHPAIPISAQWGVTVQLELDEPVRHRLEEWGSDHGGAAHFEATPLGEVTVLGATRSPTEPDRERVAQAVLERARRFLPAVSEARVLATRSCPRPLSADGWPLIGPVPGLQGVHVAAGHGPLGISLGPASARIAADAALGIRPAPATWRVSR
jgi:glycine/D-amino acid oxidase-like deaminating enzyme